MSNVDKDTLPNQSKVLQNFINQTENIGLINFNRRALDFDNLGIVFDSKLIPAQSFTFEIAIPKKLLENTKSKKDTRSISITTNDPNIEISLPDSSRLNRIPARFKNKSGVSGKLDKLNEIKALLEPVQFWVDMSVLKK